MVSPLNDIKGNVNSSTIELTKTGSKGGKKISNIDIMLHELNLS